MRALPHPGTIPPAPTTPALRNSSHPTPKQQMQALRARSPRAARNPRTLNPIPLAGNPAPNLTLWPRLCKSKRIARMVVAPLRPPVSRSPASEDAFPDEITPPHRRDEF